MSEAKPPCEHCKCWERASPPPLIFTCCRCGKLVKVERTPVVHAHAVHFCTYASQPDIQIACDESWTTAKWHKFDEPAPALAEGVYQANNDKLYTFEAELVTCERCQPIAGMSEI